MIIIFLILATISDLYNRTIPNLLLIGMFLYSIYLNHNSFPVFFISLLISLLVILPLYKLNFFAGGDAKLLIILGTIVGYSNLHYLFPIIFIIGGLQSLIYKLFFQNKNQDQKNIPYALSIFIGYIIFFYYF